MNKKVSIQGFEGSFHQMAARQFYGKDTQVICCATFKEVIKIAENKNQSNGGVMAIENSIAGSILANYTLLQKSKLNIIGEVYLPVKQHLLVNADVALEDIKEVQSHPMALLQCYEYLDTKNWKLIESDDTALSAKHIHQHKSKHIAAIASKLAAELYELKIIVPNIHTQKNNYTRFLILQPKDQKTITLGADKASINFATNHQKGSLAKVLNKIAEANINLSKLQSMPIPGTEFQYSFHADVEFENPQQFQKLIEKIKPFVNELTVFGLYKRGKKNNI